MRRIEEDKTAQINKNNGSTTKMKKSTTSNHLSPVCYPFASMVGEEENFDEEPATSSFTKRKITRIYFAHMRKAGGTTLREYLKSVADSLNIQFVATEGGHFEVPGSDENTLYVTHLRDPYKRSISHFEYEVRWPCLQLLKNESFVPTYDNEANLTAWIVEKEYFHPSIRQRVVNVTDSPFHGTQKFLIDCSTNCYIRWINHPDGTYSDDIHRPKSIYYYKALEMFKKYDVIIDTDRLFGSYDDDDGYAKQLEEFFGLRGMTSHNTPMYCLRPSRNANRNYPLIIDNTTRDLLYDRNQADYDLYNELTQCHTSSNRIVFPQNNNVTLVDFVRIY